MKGTALVLNVALAGAIAIGATGIQGLHAEEHKEYKPKWRSRRSSKRLWRKQRARK